MNDNDGRTMSAAMVEATTAIGGSADPSLGSLLDCARSVVSHAPSSQTTATTFRRSTVSSQQRQRRAQWKGIGSRCMWDAFRASMFSLFCLLVGSIIVIIGYYSELPSMEMAAFNQTLLLVDPRSQKRIKLSYSYLGAVLIGIGAFFLIAVWVAIVEMRDLTSKVFPLTRRYPAPPKRPKKRRGVGGGSKKSQSSSYQVSSQRVLQQQCELITAVVVDERHRFRSWGTQTTKRRFLAPHHWSSLKPLRRWSLLAVGTVSEDVNVVVPNRPQKSPNRRKKNADIPPMLHHYVTSTSQTSSSSSSSLFVLPVACATVSCPQLDTVS